MLQATDHSCGARQNSTRRNFVLSGPIITKLDVTDLVGDIYSTRKLILDKFGWVVEFTANR